MARTTRVLAALLLAVSALAAGAPPAQPLVYNGSFRQATDGRPDGWQTAGRADIVQTLAVQADPERGGVARLECTHFVPGTPDAHVMLAQVGRVGVTKGRWYRFSLWMRSEGMEGGAVNVALTDTRVWSDVGLYRAFPVGTRWQQFEATFQATRDLPPDASRLQIWFGRTGSLYVSDVALEPSVEPSRRWHPELPLDGVTNAVPNSSFECGGAGWGCWSGQSASWGTSLFHRVGEWDATRAYHGKASWKLTVPDSSARMLYFDYYDPMAQPVRSALLGHEGWVPVERGKPYTFSAYADGRSAGHAGPRRPPGGGRRPALAVVRRRHGLDPRAAHLHRAAGLRLRLRRAGPERRGADRGHALGGCRPVRGRPRGDGLSAARGGGGVRRDGPAGQHLHRPGGRRPLPPTGLQRRGGGTPAARHGRGDGLPRLPGRGARVRHGRPGEGCGLPGRAPQRPTPRLLPPALAAGGRAGAGRALCRHRAGAGGRQRLRHEPRVRGCLPAAAGPRGGAQVVAGLVGPVAAGAAEGGRIRLQRPGRADRPRARRRRPGRRAAAFPVGPVGVETG